MSKRRKQSIKNRICVQTQEDRGKKLSDLAVNFILTNPKYAIYTEMFKNPKPEYTSAMLPILLDVFDNHLEEIVDTSETTLERYPTISIGFIFNRHMNSDDAENVRKFIRKADVVSPEAASSECNAEKLCTHLEIYYRYMGFDMQNPTLKKIMQRASFPEYGIKIFEIINEEGKTFLFVERSNVPSNENIVHEKDAEVMKSYENYRWNGLDKKIKEASVELINHCIKRELDILNTLQRINNLLYRKFMETPINQAIKHAIILGSSHSTIYDDMQQLKSEGRLPKNIVLSIDYKLPLIECPLDYPLNMGMVKQTKGMREDILQEPSGLDIKTVVNNYFSENKEKFYMMFPCSVMGIFPYDQTPIRSQGTWEIFKKAVASYFDMNSVERLSQYLALYFVPPNQKHLVVNKVLKECHGIDLPNDRDGINKVLDEYAKRENINQKEINRYKL